MAFNQKTIKLISLKLYLFLWVNNLSSGIFLRNNQPVSNRWIPASMIYLSNAFAGSDGFFAGSAIIYGIVSGPYNFPISAAFHPPNENRRFIDTEPIAPDIEPIDQEDKRLKGLFDDKPKEKKMGEKVEQKSTI